MKIKGSDEIVVAVDPDGLWRMLSDITRTTEWSPDVEQSRWLSPWTGPEAGAQFESVNRLPIVRRWRSRSTVTESVPGRVFAFAVGNDAADPNTTWRWDLEAVPEGTRVRLSYEMLREPWIVLVYYRLTNRPARVRRGVRTTLERLKLAAEPHD